MNNIKDYAPGSTTASQYKEVKVEVYSPISSARAALPTLHKYTIILVRFVCNCRNKDTRLKRLSLVSRLYAITTVALGMQQVT